MVERALGWPCAREALNRPVERSDWRVGGVNRGYGGLISTNCTLNRACRGHAITHEHEIVTLLKTAAM
jgi:hypothetical protein